MSINNKSAPALPEILALHGKWRATDEALVCEDQRLNWSQLIALSHTFANGLIDKGIKSQDRIGVVMSNGIPMLQTLLGCMAGNFVSVPINLSVNDEALVNMMIDAQVTVVVTSTDQQQRIDKLRASLPSSIALFVDESVGNEHWLSFSTLCRQQSTELPNSKFQDDDLLNIIYSSGTTGLPKGIAHTFRSRRDWAYDLSIALHYHPRVRTLLSIGLYSNISWVGMLCTLLAGGTLHIHKQFSAKSFLKTVQDENVTHTAMVPVQYQRIVDELQAHNYSVASMQAMMCCGSPLHVDLKQQLFRHFPCGVIELYGLTEGIITTLDPEMADGRWESVGRPLLGTDIKILDDNDQPLDNGSSGEIVSLGRIAMHSYFHNPEATEESQWIDEEGSIWLRSGDIGYLDNEGYLYIVDRKKDMILSGGQNIYPQDIEALLKTNDAVYDVAVIGVKSQRWGETPLALVIPSTNQGVAQDILAWANTKLGKQQRLADVILVTQLPRNPNGKLLKRELRKEFKEVCYE